ncbi:unnamed protein product [Caenorhabditis nigoni]
MSKVAYDTSGKVIGFATVIIYPSGECVLSPLYVDDQRVAQAIFKNVLEQIPLDDKKLLRFHVRSVDKIEKRFDFLILPLEKSDNIMPLFYCLYKT